MEPYNPRCRVLEHDKDNRIDQETWNVVGNDGTLTRMLQSEDDIEYFLGKRALGRHKRLICELEEQLYDRLSYN